MQKKNNLSAILMIIGILYTVCLICGNLLATKQLQFGSFNITAAVIIFPVTYILSDCITEVWGYKKMRFLIWTAFAVNLFFSLVCLLADAIPGAPYWDNDEGFHAIFGLVPRITIASFLGFMAGSFVNGWIMSKMKLKQKGRHFGLRAVVSSIFGEAVDSCIFFPLALAGVVPFRNILSIIFWQIVIKNVYEIVLLPLTTYIIKLLKKHCEVDEYDNDISYNPFLIKDI